MTLHGILTPVGSVSMLLVFLYFGGNTGTNYAYILVALSGLSGIPGYVDPSTVGNEAGTLLSEMAFAIRVDTTTGTISTVCGPQFNTPTKSIPAAYLPANCTCQNPYQWATGGSC